MKIKKFNEQIDLKDPANKERMDIINKRLSEINIKKEIENEIDFLKRIKKIVSIEFDPGDSSNIGWSIDDRVKKLEKYL